MAAPNSSSLSYYKAGSHNGSLTHPYPGRLLSICHAISCIQANRPAFLESSELITSFILDRTPAAWLPVSADLDQLYLQNLTWRVSTVTAYPRMGSLAGPEKCPELDKALGTLPPPRSLEAGERVRIYTA